MLEKSAYDLSIVSESWVQFEFALAWRKRFRGRNASFRGTFLSEDNLIVTRAKGDLVNQAKSAETLHALMELRCRQEVIERWLVNQELPEGLRQSLRATLAEVEEQLKVLTYTLPR